MIYKVNEWTYGNSCTGLRHDLSFSVPRLSSLRDPPERRDHPLELRNRSSILRAIRNIKGYGLANDWDWWVTISFDAKKLSRIKFTDRKTGVIVPLLRSSYRYLPEAVVQFFRDQRKKYGTPFHYLLIPEMHADLKNWHLHGFMSGLPSDLLVPHYDADLYVKGYLNYPALDHRFGRCSFGQIRNGEAAVYYSLKYVNKDLHSNRMNDGVHLYYHSRGLKKPELVDEPLFLDLSDEWLSSNVFTGPFGAGYARNLPSEVCDDIKSSMRLHRLCQRYGLDDSLHYREDDISSVLDLMDSQPPSPYSDFVFDLFGNKKGFDKNGNPVSEL